MDNSPPKWRWDHKNITDPEQGSGKISRDTTKIPHPTLPLGVGLD